VPPSEPVIAVIGNDVPRQMLLACGAVPYRLTGSWEGSLDSRARELLGAADAVAVRILSDLLSGRERIDALIVCNDSQAHLRLFYALRALRWETPLLLLDMPRGDTAPARRFARAQYRALVTFCAGITGRMPDGAALRSAASAERELGRALDRVRARRLVGRCSGTAALDALLVAGRRSPQEAVTVLDAAGGSYERATPTLRLHVTGSNHPDASVYRHLEQQGSVVVSEDHDTGERAWLGHAIDSDDLDEVTTGLLDAHFARIATSSTASAADRAELTTTMATAAHADAVLAFIRDVDEAPLWDLPDQQDALDAIGIPLHARSRIGADAAPTEAARAAESIRTGVRA